MGVMMLATFARAGALALTVLVVPAAALASPPEFATTTKESLSVLAGWPAGFGAHATDPEGSVVTLSWALDDGATAGNEEHVSHTWEAPGTHTATVTATDADGERATYTFSMEVKPNPSGSRPITGPPPAATLPTFDPAPQPVLEDKRFRLTKARSIAVHVSCDTGPACVGSIVLAFAGRRLGTARFSAPGGTTATTYVRVSRANAKRLAKHRSVKVALTLTVGGIAEPAKGMRTLLTR
jgi:PKD domain